MLQQTHRSASIGAPPPKTILDGLWVLLIDDEPMIARAGDDQTYLLGFKNAARARQFAATQTIDGAEPRMIVRGNKDAFLSIARAAGVVGVLVDYDPITQKYAAAAEL